ncbi:OstA-like protein [uncultured Polaribacter sp.]|uniref:OstA-like protein n=1 Tax=uncultured Polaribacter sp. TaxID=174711 RepID=UPI0026242838|nr:OstA-like protein [uncultured Polaribacter sp.]
MKHCTLLLFILFNFATNAQSKKIKIINSEQTYKNQIKYPGAIVLNGDVKVSHEGVLLYCNKALYYQSKNLLHAYGNVRINQGDTLRQTSEYTNYNGETQKVISWGNVVLTDPSMELRTDTLHFDRITQQLKYDCYATINDDSNQLKSKNGVYSTVEKKFTATTNVVVNNPENKLESNHLDYFTESGQTYFYGPSTITTKESIAVAKKGFYDTKNGISRLIKDARIDYDNRTIEGDSIYSDKNKSFASSSGNIVVTDTINNMILKGGYAELYKDKDSVLVIKRPVAISTAEIDSLFIHGDTLLITGRPEERIIRAYHHVKFFKTDLRGKCDSLYTNQKSGITKMFKAPIIWSGENQITGDSIHLKSNKLTNKLDSLFIKKNAFIIQKDSAGYSQIKGKDMYGKFVNNELSSLLTKGNGQVINYARDERGILVAILNMSCSNILFELKENNINTIKFLQKPEGKTYPPSKYPEDLKLLKGFLWREKEKPLTKEDIFIHDDEPYVKGSLLRDFKAMPK